MNHIEKIAAQLPEYGLDAMLITSESGERYALGFHGEGLLLVTKDGAILHRRPVHRGCPGADHRRGGPAHHPGQGAPGPGEGVYRGEAAAQYRL